VAPKSAGARVLDILRDARPALPEGLSDRQQDCVEPLLAIADIAGKDCPEMARMALKELCTEARQSDGSIGVQLLADIRQFFESRKVDKVSSVELAEALAAIETSPWGEWSHGKPLSAPKLARLLRPFEVSPHPVRDGDAVFKGYEQQDFGDSFRRYLPFHAPVSKELQRLQTNTGAGFRDFFKELQSQNVTLPKCEIANVDAGCNRVTVLTPISGIQEQVQVLAETDKVREKVIVDALGYLEQAGTPVAIG
jgi:Protein of unknown function (DUF3631)